jgi:hypothetical protein
MDHHMESKFDPINEPSRDKGKSEHESIASSDTGSGAVSGTKICPDLGHISAHTNFFNYIPFATIMVGSCNGITPERLLLPPPILEYTEYMWRYTHPMRAIHGWDGIVMIVSAEDP